MINENPSLHLQRVYANRGLIPSRRLCRARSLKPEISGKAVWQARHNIQSPLFQLSGDKHDDLAGGEHDSPKIINDWPHQDCARCVVNLMMDQGYSAKSLRSTIQTISAFVEWKKDCRNGGPAVVLYDDIDRFIECRAATATLRHGERRSIRLLRAKLIEAGVVHQPPPARRCSMIMSWRPVGSLATGFDPRLRPRWPAVSCTRPIAASR